MFETGQPKASSKPKVYAGQSKSSSKPKGLSRTT